MGEGSNAKNGLLYNQFGFLLQTLSHLKWPHILIIPFRRALQSQVWGGRAGVTTWCLISCCSPIPTDNMETRGTRILCFHHCEYLITSRIASANCAPNSASDQRFIYSKFGDVASCAWWCVQTAAILSTDGTRGRFQQWGNGSEHAAGPNGDKRCRHCRHLALYGPFT